MGHVLRRSRRCRNVKLWGETRVFNSPNIQCTASRHLLCFLLWTSQMWSFYFLFFFISMDTSWTSAHSESRISDKAKHFLIRKNFMESFPVYWMPRPLIFWGFPAIFIFLLWKWDFFSNIIWRRIIKIDSSTFSVFLQWRGCHWLFHVFCLWTRMKMHMHVRFWLMTGFQS